MATPSNGLFGWDLTFKIIEKDIKKKSDVLIAFVHWNLCRNGFRNIGVGNETTITGNEEKSELLPAGWNNNENFVMRYILYDKLYILHGIHSDENLIINLMKSDDLVVTNIAWNVQDVVKGLSGPIDKIIPENRELIFNIKRDLISPVTERITNTAETQTTATGAASRSEDVLWMTPPRRQNFDVRDMTPVLYPPNIGGSDLDPFREGGGMIFQPFQPRRDPENPGLGIPGGLPRGAVPPGARFDPFGPPGGPMPGRRPPPPDADHLPPPGFNDNMFM